MNVFDHCPKCKSIGMKIPTLTVSHHLGNDLEIQDGDWFICSGSTCQVAYFTGNTMLLLEDLRSKLWFKDQAMNVPVCYCSNITREEIYRAVDEGCSNIKEVRHFLRKHKTGDCELKNPVGGCCHKVFQREIKHRMAKVEESN